MNMIFWLTLLGQTAIPFLIGTKFDQFATFPRDEQEEITKQVLHNRSGPGGLTHSSFTGKTFRACHARVADFLLDVRFDKRTEDLQDRPCKSI